jgi:hypothetical protein
LHYPGRRQLEKPASVDERSVFFLHKVGAQHRQIAPQLMQFLCGRRVILQVLRPPRHNGAMVAYSLYIRLRFVVVIGRLLWRIVTDTTERTAESWKNLEHRNALPREIRAAVEKQILGVAAAVGNQ